MVLVDPNTGRFDTRAHADTDESSCYAAAWSPSGEQLAHCGSEGTRPRIRLQSAWP